MRWIWDAAKNRANKRKHGISFETAQLVFNDPLHLIQPDPSDEEERWQAIGMVGSVVLFVVHRWPEFRSHGAEEVGRIISARKATARERNVYEEAQF